MSEIDLKPQPELADRIQSWILEKSRATSTDAPTIQITASSSNNNNNRAAADKKPAENDDLYDF